MITSKEELFELPPLGHRLTETDSVVGFACFCTEGACRPDECTQIVVVEKDPKNNVPKCPNHPNVGMWIFAIVEVGGVLHKHHHHIPK